MAGEYEKNIKKLLLLKRNDKFIINNEYECTIKSNKSFPTFVKDNNCPRYFSDTIVKVKDHSMLAQIQVSWNIDLENDLDCNLCFYDKKDLVSMITVTDIKFI